jgi:hypothetical protein
MVEVQLTVGKLDASLALLLTKDHHLIEFPTILLPDGVNAGSVVTIKCEQDIQQEQEEKKQFEELQEQILHLFGTNEPHAPKLRLKNVTQTSAVLEWDPVELGSATIKSLTLYKNGTRLGHIPNPLITTTTKLSGLQIDSKYVFHLRLDTTAGVYESEHITVHTHKMTDLSGITVCLGNIDAKEGFTREDIEESLKKIGAKSLQDEVKVDTTHFIATIGLGPQWKKAADCNIPVVRPEWLKACETERRIVGVRNFYLDADPKFFEGYKGANGSLKTNGTSLNAETAETTQSATRETAAESQDIPEESSEQVKEEIPEEPVTQEADQTTEVPTEETVEEPTESVTEYSDEEVTEQLGGETIVEPVETPAEEFSEQSTEEPAKDVELSAEESAKVAETPAEELAEEPNELQEEAPTEIAQESATEDAPVIEDAPTEGIPKDEPEASEIIEEPETDGTTEVQDEEFDDVDINANEEEVEEEVEDDDTEEPESATTTTAHAPKKKNKNKNKKKKSKK